jgi:hypothetical protein
MTSDKRLKARIRARMAKTGERYTTARRHFVSAVEPAPDVLGYTLRGGQHPDSAALANVLAHAGVTASDGTPLSEAIVFGLTGGLGAGYILWEFRHDDSRIVTLGFSNQSQYFGRGLRKALDRLGISYGEHTTGGAKGAATRLESQLDHGVPALIWPDRYLIGYWQLPESLDGHGGHPVVVYGRDGDRVYVDDRNGSPLTVDIHALHRARARVGSYKNALIAPTPDPGPIDAQVLRTGVNEGIADCVAQLSSTSASFALPAWRKWARLMTDTRNAKGWPSVFDDRRGLVGALLSVWEGTSQFGMTGGHLRDLYADFLTEAGPLLETTFDGPINSLREASRLWTELGEIAADPAIEDLARLRHLTATIRESIAADGDHGQAEASAAGAELWKLRTELDAECPLGDDAVRALFARMSEVIERIYEVETAAVADLARLRSAGV